MSLLTFIIVGLIAGWLAGMIMRGGGLGIIWDIIIGVIGAIVGGYLFSALDIGTEGSLLWNILIATVGAVVVLFVINLVAGKGFGARRHRLT